MFEGKFKFLMNDLGKEIQSFEKSLNIDLNNYDEFEVDIFKNGQIQKFEYTIELLWKTIKQFLEEKRDKRVIYPLEALKAFFAEEAIDEETYNVFFAAIKSRNVLSHVYKLEVFENIYPYLKNYPKAISSAYSALQSNAI